MRAGIVVAVVSLSLVSVAAYADSTAPESFTGNVSVTASSTDTSAFAQFDTSLGTLDSVTVEFSGTLESEDAIVNTVFSGLTANNEPSSTILVTGTGGVPADPGATNTITADGTFSSDLSYFEGTGTTTLALEFLSKGVADTYGTTGTITYNYTPAVVTPPPAATPEPSSLALLGSGVLGLAGVVRRRMAR
jgi:hypothetical protein